MDEEKNRVIIVDKSPKFFKDGELTSHLDISLPIDSEFEIDEVEENNSVRVILPDSTVAYIHGDEEVNVIQRAWAVKDTKIYRSPEMEKEPKILPKGSEFEILNSVPGTNDQWLRLKIEGKYFGYMRGSARVQTDATLADAIAENIGTGASEDKVVKTFTGQGIPEELVREYYQVITTAAAQYEDSPEGRKELAGRYARKILWGILWAVGGTIATVVSYDSSSSGGTYYIFYGAIIWGVIDIIRGIIGWAKYS